MSKVTLEWLRANYAGDLDAVLAAQSPQRKPVAVIPGQPTLIHSEASEGRYVAVIANWRPASDNALTKSVGQRIRVKKRDRAVIHDCLGLEAGFPIAIRKRRVSLLVEKRRKPLPDPANLNKSLRDALKMGEFLRDDSADWCLGVEPEVRVNKGLEYPVVSTITLEDL